MPYWHPVAPEVVRVTFLLVNAYLVGARDGSWMLVDSGLPWAAGVIRRAAEDRYGRDARPVAIVLTHGHVDHASAALELAALWDVPVYAHRLEMPYLTGASDYPPPDPTVGGAIGVLARFLPHTGFDFGRRVRALPAHGSVPGLPGWQVLHVPGHTAGQVAFFREADRVLLAGDALATVDLGAPMALLGQSPAFARPTPPFTTDWLAARRSVEQLAGLRPTAVAAGHGRPMIGPHVAVELHQFATRFAPPPTGRYVAQPARTDEHGVAWVPPPVPDPLPRRAAGVALLAAGIVVWRRRQARRAGVRVVARSRGNTTIGPSCGSP